MSENTEEADEKCPLQPEFEGPPTDRAQEVKLTREKYVQLLVDARETDPGCWPPGLEDAARMLERAREIEELGASKHGVFDPNRLSKKLQDEYFQIHLALDDLQDGLETSNDDESDSLIATEALTLPAWPEFAPHTRPENFA